MATRKTAVKKAGAKLAGKEKAGTSRAAGSGASPGTSRKVIGQMARVQKAMDKLLAAEEALSREIDMLGDLIGGAAALAGPPVIARLMSVVPVDVATALARHTKSR